VAKLDAYKFTGGQQGAPGGGAAIATVVTPLTNSSVKALGNISKSLGGIDQTLKGLYSVSMSSIKNDKLRAQAERRRLQRERDAAREEEIENRPSASQSAGLAKTGNLTKEQQGWGSKIFKALFGGLEGLMFSAFRFLVSLASFAAVRTILQIVGDPQNRAKMELFFTKLQFVWNKISGFTNWLVKDNLLDGFTSLFGENKTFGERLQGLGKLLIGIIGLKLLLDPFGLIFGVLDLLNARERAAAANQGGGVDTTTTGGQRGTTTPKKIPPTRRRDILLKRSRVDRLSRLRTSLRRIKAKQFGPIDALRVGVRRPGRLPGMVGTGLKQTPRMILRGFKGLASGAKSFIGRIPVIGALINFVLETLDVDAQGNLKLDLAGRGESAAYKSIGMAIGAAAGSFIPVPIVGSIVGGLLGEYGGSLIYDMVKGASGSSIMARMKQDFQNSMRNIGSGAQAAGEWVKGAWNKWYGGVDKVKFPDVPNWVKNTPFVGKWVSGFPIWGMMVPDPSVITNPVAAGFKYGMNFFKSLFGGVVEAGKLTLLPGASAPPPGADTGTTGQTTDAPPAQSSPQRSSTSAGHYPGKNQSPEMRALLNVIAFAEGTRDQPNNGYNTHFAFGQEPDLSAHPNKVVTSGRYASAAFGRYQFMPRTWIGVGGACKAGGPIPYTRGMDMSPANQDKGAEILAIRRGVSTSTLRKEGFSVNVSSKLSGEWASIPNAAGKSAYDQPVRKYEQLKQLYNQELGKRPAANQTTTPPANTSSTGNNQWWDFLNVFPDEENTVPERPIGQKATLNGKPVIWNGKSWVPAQAPEAPAAVPVATGLAALMKGVLALTRAQAGLSPVPESARAAFIKGVNDGTFKLYLAPDGMGAAGATLQAGGSLVDAAGNMIGGFFGGGGSGGGGYGYGGGGGGSTNPYDAAYSKEELDDPIGAFLDQAYPSPKGSGPSGNPFSQPLTKEGIANNFYGYNPLSIADGWEIFKKKVGIGTPQKEEKYGLIPDGFSADVKTSGIDFGSLFNFSAGGPLPNNLPQAFLGKIFKGVSKFVGGIVKGVTNAVKSVGKALTGVLNSPIGQLVAFGLSFTPLAPIVAGIKAVAALTQGDIMGALVGGMGALGGMFPGTFGAEGTFFAGLNKTFGEGLGGVMKGFLTGGFGGALGALPGMLPEGMQAMFKGIGGFLEENQGVAKIAQMLPGVMGATGFGQMLGLPQPQAMGGMGTLGAVFAEGNATGILAAVMGEMMGTRSFQNALGDIASELGVDPMVLGGVLSRSRMTNPLDEKSREYALQTKIEVQQMPIVIEKLVAIPKAVPINNYVPVKQPAR